MDIYHYVVQHDKGFAPNPFFKTCTLACCKPRIRQKAKVGDIIIGFASDSQEVGLGGHVIYWMKVDEIINFDHYWADTRFVRKRPVMGSSLMSCYGDNIYHSNQETGEWVQDYSFHSDGEGLGRGNLDRDIGRTDRVLISKDYTYWGANAPEFPNTLKGLIPRGRAERWLFSNEEKAQILEWLGTIKERGFQGEPADWQRDHPQDENGLISSLKQVR